MMESLIIHLSNLDKISEYATKDSQYCLSEISHYQQTYCWLCLSIQLVYLINIIPLHPFALTLSLRVGLLGRHHGLDHCMDRCTLCLVCERVQSQRHDEQ